jgi:hypothetical protein
MAMIFRAMDQAFGIVKAAKNSACIILSRFMVGYRWGLEK